MAYVGIFPAVQAKTQAGAESRLGLKLIGFGKRQVRNGVPKKGPWLDTFSTLVAVPKQQVVVILKQIGEPWFATQAAISML